MRYREDCRGQGTVEAAVVIPVLFLLLLLLLQPGIVLYDYIVMRGAAAEACRLVAVSGADAMDGCQDFIRNRLSAIPQHRLFHIHEGGCSWSIDIAGSEQSASAIVTIRNLIEPLPLCGGALALLGVTDGEGRLILEAEEWAPTQPEWLSASVPGGPASWVEEW